ncbi:SEL1-like repeat protein [Pseudohalocynthiibacter sp. F2068]|nr:SEL1-like repeat protein [Pseudohalocynthiibacter sp. F2068]
MYEAGEGVPQNYLSAHMWYNISGANGHELGRTNRDKIKAQMTPTDISEAQRLARVCMESNYQDCD